MSKLLSLKLNDDLFTETEDILHSIKIPRNAYINQAVDFFNKIQKRNILKKKLHVESKLVSQNSLEVLKEFEKLEDSFEWKNGKYGLRI